MMAVSVNAGPPSGWGVPEILCQLIAPFVVAAGAAEFDISTDGRRFLMIKKAATADAAAAAQIMVIPNWHEELKRLVPR